ncbi:glycoside hydrolase family 3 protein [Amnibacterium kyonggiense]|uniref:beta-glucosidase n=1 Tax=Amnibacterium kyonggiense TaxID=595671 RepID=A0A4V3EA74_9MICO|nr:glycoside hydrolase family 3 N-terminal domain-containing protein [Amnibacterium kyonggiense]TDS75044.1 beta-glucosidase [Amnibacterium kyonggiense]
MSRERLVAPDGTAFRDLDHDGVMAPFEDPRLSAEERADDLVARLSLEEKAGLCFQDMLAVGSADDLDDPGPYGASPASLAQGLLLNHFNLHGLPAPAEAARWQNAMQDLAAATPHGVPITFSSDPRHAVADAEGGENVGVALATGAMSAWPEPLGLAAIGDADVVRSAAEAARREYVAVGIRAALHPQADVSADPRWGRQAQTYGTDAALVARLTVAELEGLHGDGVGPDAVAATVKHFPGGGVRDGGEDSHFPYGADQSYPGDRFEEHLAPFRAAIDAGVANVMPAYGKPVGLVLDGEPVPEVAFGFNRPVITGLLREELGFDGVVVTDWGLVSDLVIGPLTLPARAWGLEDASAEDRMVAIFDAGCDQLGGERLPGMLAELVRSGRIAAERLDESVRRLLLVKFRLGLFDDPYVDPSAAEAALGAPDLVAAGRRAQSEAVTVIEDRGAALPLRPGARVLPVHLAADAVTGAGLVPVTEASEAELAIVRITAPFEPRNRYFLEGMFHAGSLEPAAETIAEVRDLAERLPVVLVVSLDRPAILTPVADAVAALVGVVGCSDAALLDALTGAVPPRGRLPFDLPRSAEAVAAVRPDVPNDTADPLFRAGTGGA